MKIVQNVVKYTYKLLVTFADGRQEEREVEAESLTAAGLLLPPDAVAWESIGDRQM